MRDRSGNALRDPLGQRWPMFTIHLLFCHKNVLVYEHFYSKFLIFTIIPENSVNCISELRINCSKLNPRKWICNLYIFIGIFIEAIMGFVYWISWLGWLGCNFVLCCFDTGVFLKILQDFMWLGSSVEHKLCFSDCFVDMLGAILKVPQMPMNTCDVWKLLTGWWVTVINAVLQVNHGYFAVMFLRL